MLPAYSATRGGQSRYAAVMAPAPPVVSWSRLRLRACVIKAGAADAESPGASGAVPGTREQRHHQAAPAWVPMQAPTRSLIAAYSAAA